MRDAETFLFDDQVSVENQIEVEGTRSAGIWPFTPEAALHIKQHPEQVARCEGCVSDRSRIEKSRLISHANGRRVMKG